MTTFQFTHPGGVRRELIVGERVERDAVSIHAPGRGATAKSLTLNPLHFGFQFTHPGGVRPSQDAKVTLTSDVSIHAPGRGATRYGIARYIYRPAVSIHAPGRGATWCSLLSNCYARFQFTHPGGVRPNCGYPEFGDIPVSIHAPGRGATGVVNLPEWLNHVSIHAPGRGATREVVMVKISGEFQFTHPGGVRPYYTANYNVNTKVSIHAPGRGATPNGSGTNKFQGFQFTHPGGVRLERAAMGASLHRRFNSRTREGCDVVGPYSPQQA